MAPSLVGTELDRTGRVSHSGYVDLIDCRGGVRGWAVNLADPFEPVRVQLCLGGRTVAETLGLGERPDISAGLGVKARAAFHFDTSAMLALPNFVGDPSEVLSVRIADTGQYLSTTEEPLTGAEILAQLRPDQPGQAAEQNRSPATATDLELLLDELRDDAAGMADQALRPLPENLQGYIETIALTITGQVWFMGWIKRGHVQEFSAVVVERRKYPAAVAVMSYLRDDLPEDACGIVGLISSPWRPNSGSRDVHLYFGDNGRFYLRSHEPFRILPSSELVAEYEGIRDRCLDDGRSNPLHRMLGKLENWLPARNAAQLHGTETSVDRVLLVPGLGCFVEGWVISPMKRIDSLRLRIGASIMTVHSDSLYWKPRRDLLDAFPGSERLAEQAGFVGFFTGDAEPDDFADPVLKVIFDDGSSANWVVASRAFRRLGHSATVQDAMMFFPALQEEVFFPRFADAAIRAERGAMNLPVAIAVTRTRQVMVFVLPEDRSDIFLLFEELAEQCRRNGPVGALAFIAAARSNRSDALWLFREFQSAYGIPRGIACSLLVIDDAAQAFDLLPDILRETGAQRFFFAGSGVFLSPDGWKGVHDALSAGDDDLVFFGVEGEEFERLSEADMATARCFAWSAGPFTRWASTATAFMGGFYKDNALLRADAGKTMHPRAARSMRTLLRTRIEEAVNAVVYAGAGDEAAGRLGAA